MRWPGRWRREVYETPEEQAERRWLARNDEADARRQCECGAPGTVRRTSTYAVTGRIRPVWWFCDEHAAVSEDVPWVNGKPLIGQSRETCTWSTGRIDTGVITACGCGTHVGETRGRRCVP